MCLPMPSRSRSLCLQPSGQIAAHADGSIRRSRRRRLFSDSDGSGCGGDGGSVGDRGGDSDRGEDGGCDGRCNGGAAMRVASVIFCSCLSCQRPRYHAWDNPMSSEVGTTGASEVPAAAGDATSMPKQAPAARRVRCGGKGHLAAPGHGGHFCCCSRCCSCWRARECARRCRARPSAWSWSR